MNEKTKWLGKKNRKSVSEETLLSEQQKFQQRKILKSARLHDTIKQEE